MTVQSVLLPIFVYVLLVFSLLAGMVRATGAQNAARARLFSASFSNQFEIPVLFLALVAFALLTQRADTVFVVLEWLFVLARFIHAGVHVTSNAQPQRMIAFAAGSILLLIGWIKLAIEVLAAA